MNPEDRERLIRDRAHLIWIEEGRPDARHTEHWIAAERAIDEEEGATTPLTDLTAEPVPPNR